MAKTSGNAVVIEGMQCTSGGEVWDPLFEKESSDSPASVICARWYDIDSAQMSEELYEQEKENYPVLYFCMLEYDGKEYTLTVRESGEKEPEMKESYRYLLHLTGDNPPSAAYSSYEHYVLTDDPSVTWEEILERLSSSRSSAMEGFRYYPVYQNIID